MLTLTIQEPESPKYLKVYNIRNLAKQKFYKK